ncbi:MAG: hypothetical protein P9F75_04545 [Candidatus Contendobacter sp.]|nr:hypothetical protein [Candidatus Contendobacter sp.]
MPKKKEPTETPVKKAPSKTAKQVEGAAPAQKTMSLPVEPAKAEPAPTPAKAEKPTTPAPAKAEPAPAPAKAEKPAAPAKVESAPAPAKVEPAPAPAPAKAEKPTAPAKVEPAPAKAEKPAAPAKAEKPAASESVVTVVVAKYDVGHGNNMFIRGEGASLNWESGIQMENAGNDVWVWTTNELKEGAVSFKFLINDVGWSAGDNMTAPAGETTTLYPAF